MLRKTAFIIIGLGMPHVVLAETVRPVTSIRVSSGVSYSSGKYGDPVATEVLSAPISVKVVRGPLSIRVSIPYVQLRGPGSLIDTPVGGIPAGGSGGSGGSGSGGSGSGNGNGGEVTPGGASRRVSGFGDTNVALTYSFELGRTAWFDTSAKVKIPTASTSKGLGTGRVDVTLQGEFAKEIGKLGLYAGGRRKFAGSSAQFPVRDTWGAGGGINYRVAGTASVGLDYDWQQSSFAGNGAISEITAWTSFRLAKRVRLYVYGSTGTNSNSVDAAGGLTVTYRFD